MVNQLKNKKEKYVKVCPKCGSTDAQIDFSNPVVWAYGTNVKYKCSSCGYLGSLFPEILEGQIKSYKKELNEKEKKEAARIKTPNSWMHRQAILLGYLMLSLDWGHF